MNSGVIITLVGKTEYGDDIISKHGNKWKVSIIMESKLLVKSMDDDYIFKWITLQDKHFEVLEEY